MKVYVTKYALSDGIREVECIHHDEDGYADVKWPGGLNGTALFSKREWALTRDAAITRAEEMRKAKIASVKKQLARLEAMTF